jgi:predicted PurR-regulated permease PerM
MVRRLERKNFPRIASILIMIVLCLGLVVGIGTENGQKTDRKRKR